MAQEYDRIIKENIEAVFLPLAEKYLGIKIQTSRKISPKMQTTLEREADFLRIVTSDKPEKFILHIEFQTTDEADMVYRMAEYNAILLRKYKLPVRQFVVYLGERHSKMRTTLTNSEAITGFQLTNVMKYSYRELLTSEIPEEIILAILSDYGNEKPVDIIRFVMRRLQEVSGDEIKLRKYIRQLTILSRLRKLESETIKQVENMPITYDIKNDYWYKEGRQEGKEEGKQEGKQEGRQEGKQEKEREIILKMLQSGSFSEKEVAGFVGVPVTYVEQLKRELKKNN